MLKATEKLTLVTRCPVLVQSETIATVAVVGARDVDTQLLTLVLAAVTFVDVCEQRQNALVLTALLFVFVFFACYLTS